MRQLRKRSAIHDSAIEQSLVLSDLLLKGFCVRHFISDGINTYTNSLR